MDRKINGVSAVFGAMFIALLLFASCTRPDLEPLRFFEVETQAPTVLSAGRLRLTGRILYQSDATIDSCGFLWGAVAADVQGQGTGARRFYVAPPASEQPFTVEVNDLEPDKTYYFRSFAQSGARRVLGEIQGYTLGNIVTSAGLAALVANDTVMLYGRLTGLETQGLRVEEHGFVYSGKNQLPTVTDPDCILINLGSANDDTIFNARITGLPFNQPLYARPYAKAGNRLFYAAEAEKVPVRGGWKKRSNFGSYHLAATTTLDGKGYAGFGMSLPLSYIQGNLDRNGLYEFDTASGWRTLPPIDFQKRTEVALFGLKGGIFTLSGGYLPFVSNCPDVFTLLDFRRFDLAGQKWEEQEEAPMQARLKAVSFVLNGKAYFGLGRINVYDASLQDCRFRDSLLSDFWEFNPDTKVWRPVAPLPYRKTGETQERTGGRVEAIHFTDGAFGYVGGGANQSEYLLDLWRFVPPANDQEMGRWEFVSYLPGVPRADAVAFSVGAKAYMGCGYNPDFGFLSDFWELDIARGRWRALPPFPGGSRGNAFAFSLHGRAYMGTGIRRKWDGVSSSLDILPDFWEYVPDR